MSRFCLSCVMIVVSMMVLLVQEPVLAKSNGDPSQATVGGGTVEDAGELTTTTYFTYILDGDSSTLTVRYFPRVLKVITGPGVPIKYLSGSATADWEYTGGPTSAKSITLSKASTVPVSVSGNMNGRGHSTSSLGLGNAAVAGYCDDYCNYYLSDVAKQPRLQWLVGQSDTLTGSIYAESQFLGY